MITLTVPELITLGLPFEASFSSTTRIAGRLRLTSGDQLVPFTLVRVGHEPVHGETHRLRGKQGIWQISNWGEHEVGVELVLRFEGAKGWMRVQSPA